MARGTLLVVDDTPGMIYFLQEALKAAGYRVVSSIAIEAVQLAQDLQPDLVLLDILMPGLDGPELGRRLRADARTAAIPIMALSALPELTVRLHCQEMGANDYLVKPFNLDDLLGRVEKWVNAATSSHAPLLRERLARASHSPLPI